MAAGSASSPTICFKHNPVLGPKPTSTSPPVLLFSPLTRNFGEINLRCRRKPKLTVCFVLENEKLNTQSEIIEAKEIEVKIEEQSSAARLAEKLARKRSERFTYLVAAVMSSLGITSMAVLAIYYRFSWQMEGGEVSFSEMFGTFALSFGAAVGMEFWAIWAHRALWHDSLWHMHESHHKPREGAFELNDVFAITNAVPAIALLAYGFFNKGLIPGLCFGAGLGITVFGMAYMFVHDGLVHKRFPVGPIANVPYFRRIAAAHQLHHSEKFNGVPYGLFLGPKELEEVGGNEELEKEAIEALNDENGSNKSAIAKQIDASYGTLPPAHGTLLAHHLNKMKQSGQLVMVKNNYMKPDPNAPPRRGRGRPPKPKAPLPEGYVPPPPRPRGRPPKERDPHAPIAVPMKITSPSSGGTGKKRGRPRKFPNDTSSPSPSVAPSPSGTPRGRGRPPKVKTPVAAEVGA